MTQGNTSGVYINELMASEKSRPHDWLEVYNSSAQAVDISGWGLSDDAASPRKWRFPQGTVIQPGDYLTLYLSGTDGVDASGIPARLLPPLRRRRVQPHALGRLRARCWTGLFVPEQYTGISYARMTDGDFLYTVESTPDQQNSAEGSQGRTAAPEASAPGGIYHTGDTITVELSAESGARIYYTLDSSLPDETDALYTGPITVSSTTVVRARAFKNGSLPSFVETQTYLYDADHEMRVVSLVADPYEMFDEDRRPLHGRPNASPHLPPHRGQLLAHGRVAGATWRCSTKTARR